MGTTPASSMEDLNLGNGWKVIRKIDPHPTSTGGCFSIGYLVHHENGSKGYLKALDFSSAHQSNDPARRLQEMTGAYNFERDLLEKCRDHKMDRVVTPISDGAVDVPGNFGPLAKVCYLIFDLAEGDIRKYTSELQTIDFAWCLRSMHNTAVGIMQLHTKGTAHQDLKPSNVLFFDSEGSKVSDLGRASDVKLVSDNDDLVVPSDTGYAPPELIYEYFPEDRYVSRFAADLYLLGSLVFFHFTGLSATQAIRVKLKNHVGPNFSKADFINDLPYIRNAFQDAIDELRDEVSKIAGTLTEQIVQITRELCEPDPARRGHPRNRSPGKTKYNLERYVSQFDLLALKAEYKLK